MVFVTWERKTRRNPLEEPVVVVEEGGLRLRMSPLAALNLMHELKAVTEREDIACYIQTEMRDAEARAGGR